MEDTSESARAEDDMRKPRGSACASDGKKQSWYETTAADDRRCARQGSKSMQGHCWTDARERATRQILRKDGYKGKRRRLAEKPAQCGYHSRPTRPSWPCGVSSRSRIARRCQLSKHEKRGAARVSKAVGKTAAHVCGKEQTHPSVPPTATRPPMTPSRMAPAPCWPRP